MVKRSKNGVKVVVPAIRFQVYIDSRAVLTHRGGPKIERQTLDLLKEIMISDVADTPLDRKT